MEKHIISGNYFPTLLSHYLAGRASLQNLYAYAPTLAGLGDAVQNRVFSGCSRQTLVQVLENQSKILGKIPAQAKANITALASSNTFTVTTGHQICLLTGPLYFVYKIASVIKLCRQLSAAYPQYNFVPVYWAATEDHDFEEIRSVFLNGKTHTWQTQASGATGEISTQDIQEFFTGLEAEHGEKLSFSSIYQTLKNAWISQPNLSAAIRRAVYDLFGAQGIVCIDANEAAFKKDFSGLLHKELFDQFSYPLLNQTAELLRNLGYKTQIEPRPINLFYLRPGLRERIVFENGSWSVLNTDIRFNKTELESELSEHPERFSPNVALRPLYQEFILPNIAYLGGPAELSYWLQFKEMFSAAGVPFPVLIPRDGFAFLPRQDFKRFLSLGFSAEQLLASPIQNLKTYVASHIGAELSTENEIREINRLFAELKNRYAAQLGQALPAFAASEKKLSNELHKLHKKALRMAARKETETASFLQSVHSRLFPGGTLSERKESIIEYAGLLGSSPAETLIELADPLQPGLKLITY